MLQHFYVICNIVNFVDMELSAGVIKWVHSLSQKKNRDKERCFVAEGTKCVVDTLDYFKVRYLFATSDWADSVGCRLRCPVTVATKVQIERMSMLKTATDVIAVYEMPDVQIEKGLEKRLALVLDGIQDPGNFGTILRIADWFGVKDVFCSKDTVDVYNPKTDKDIAVNYSVEDAIKAKAANKTALQKELGLEENPDAFMLGIVSRLTDQKGLDLVECVLDQICAEDVQLVVLGTGEGKYQDMFTYYSRKYPERVSANIFYSEALSHRIYASCDAFLMPSLFEPCGLSQLMSLRYGTLPIVRETGGLRDTVTPYNEVDGTGTGFSFTNYNAHEMLAIIRYAKKTYFNDRKAWNEMVLRAMKQDFSWDASAREYEKLYDGLIEEEERRKEAIRLQQAREAAEAALKEAEKALELAKRAEEKAIRKFSGIEDEPEDEKAEISKAEEIDETPEAAPESEEVTEVLETPETPETPEEVSETAVEE